MPIVFLVDGLFDAAVAHSVLEHMTVEDAKRGLLELDRIVRPGALFMYPSTPWRRRSESYSMPAAACHIGRWRLPVL